MDFIIYLGVFVVIMGVFTCGVAIWALATHREKKYNSILHEHIQQLERVKNKVVRGADKNNEN